MAGFRGCLHPDSPSAKRPRLYLGRHPVPTDGRPLCSLSRWFRGWSEEKGPGVGPPAERAGIGARGSCWGISTLPPIIACLFIVPPVPTGGQAPVGRNHNPGGTPAYVPS